MTPEELEDLAKQLRLSYFAGLEPIPWSHMQSLDRQPWISVAEEAIRWLVG